MQQKERIISDVKNRLKPVKDKKRTKSVIKTAIIIRNKRAVILTAIIVRCIIVKSFDFIFERFKRNAKIDGTINSVVEPISMPKLETI